MKQPCKNNKKQLVIGGLLSLLLGVMIVTGTVQSSRLLPVLPNKPLVFPKDYGAHPDFRIEWWYITGWLDTEDEKKLGFQVTFFRYQTELNIDNPSQFAAKNLIIAHLALSDPTQGRLIQSEKIAREAFDLAYSKQGNTNVKLDDWFLVRDDNGIYKVDMRTDDLGLQLSLQATQKMMLQGDQGFSRKGPKPEQASYYYSEPHLNVTGTVFRKQRSVKVNGVAWLDHEWSTAYLDTDGDGWDWTGLNLDDGSTLMMFQIRGKKGDRIWAYAALRDASGNMKFFQPDEIEFTPIRTWKSPHTEAIYPVEMRIRTGNIEWQLIPLMDDQELDSQQSTGAVYWEGAVTLMRDDKTVGRGYLELTGYAKSLTL
ncbi:MAG: carotenoid 1,2-hydratase [Nitrosomonas sp.]|nr:carotenoid 1,2-hydratase [Nitrosomonas sp.]